MAFKFSAKLSSRRKGAFYIESSIMFILIISSLIFYNTQWWQLVGMIGISVFNATLFICYRCKYCQNLLMTRKNKGYFLRFYEGIGMSFLMTFCFFCPIFIEYS